MISIFTTLKISLHLHNITPLDNKSDNIVPIIVPRIRSGPIFHSILSYLLSNELIMCLYVSPLDIFFFFTSGRATHSLLSPTCGCAGCARSADIVLRTTNNLVRSRGTCSVPLSLQYPLGEPRFPQTPSYLFYYGCAVYGQVIWLSAQSYSGFALIFLHTSLVFTSSDLVSHH